MPTEPPCRQCGQLFEPTTEDLRRGPLWWWYCDQCRSAERDPEIAD
jgi:hypothetical protein